MVFSFTADELAYLRATQDGHMMDTCVIQTHAYTDNTYNEQVESWKDGKETACGLEMTAGNERHGSDASTLVYDATLRLPIGTTANIKDRIKITKRHGAVITPIIFDVVGTVQRGSSGNRILLKVLET